MLDVRISPWLADLATDLRLALRLAVKERVFVAVAVVTLALGIAANTTVFTIINAMVLRGLPVRDAHQIVAFSDGNVPIIASHQDAEDWRTTSSLAGLGVFSTASMVVEDEGRSADVFFGAYMSASSFVILAEPPHIGRWFEAEDDRPGAARVVVLGHRVWQTRYGSSRAVLGTTIRVNGEPATIVGVMGPAFRFPNVEDLWLPLSTMPGLVMDRRDARRLRVFARLSDDASITSAQAELDAVATRLAREHPDTNRNVRPVIAPYTGHVHHTIFYALFGAMGFVLLIACANVANMLLARSIYRSREIGIRASLGATRFRIIRQLLAESALLAALAGVLALGLSFAAVQLFSNTVEGINFSYWYRDRWTMDAHVFGFAAIVCVSTVFVFGLMPACHLSRADVTTGLKNDGRSGVEGLQARRWTAALLVAEVAVTVALLTGAGLMMRSFVTLLQADRVVDTEHLARVSMRMPSSWIASPEKRLAFYEAIEHRMAAVPSIVAASIASPTPFIGAPRWRVDAGGRSPSSPSELPAASFVVVGANYFEALGLRIVVGRAFDDRDGTNGHNSLIVNQRFAAMFFAGDNPVGRRLRLVNPTPKGTPAEIEGVVVGVSQTVRHQYFSDIDPAVYVPYRANPVAGALLLVREQPDSNAVAAIVREQIRTVEPAVVAHQVTPIELDVQQSRWGHRVFGGMIAIFAGIALMLSAVGLSAVTAYGVTQRTREIGVRIALGATAANVVSLFVRRGLIALVAGLILGALGAIGVGRLVQSMLVQTSPTDPLTLSGIVALVVVISLAACYWPARRAARLDAVTALRTE